MIIGKRYPDSPEGNLWLAVLKRTILDLVQSKKTIRKAALIHVNGFIYEAEIVDIDSEWIRGVLRMGKII